MGTEWFSKFVQYMEPSFSSHIHSPVSKDLLLKHIQQISKSENIRVLLNPTQWFPASLHKLRCTWIWLVWRDTYKPRGEYSFCNRPISTLSQDSRLEAPGNHLKKHGGTKVSWNFCFFPKNRVENLRNCGLLCTVWARDVQWLTCFKMALWPSQWPSESDRKTSKLHNV